MKYFDNLPIEICMMVFDHLVTDKPSLGTICLVSYNWKTITQNSYAWKLWIYAKMGENTICGKIMMYDYESSPPPIFRPTNPLLCMYLVPDNLLSIHIKKSLVKKFLAHFIDYTDHNIFMSHAMELLTVCISKITYNTITYFT